MIEDYSINLNFSPCPHRSVTTVTTGSRRFIEGEVWDDIQEKLVCLECGEFVSEEEVRAGWGQFPIPMQEVSHGND